MRKKLLNRGFVGGLALWTLVLSAAPSGAGAFPSASVPVAGPSLLARQAQIETILCVADRADIKTHLALMGISREELREKLALLDDGQLNQVSRKAEEIKAAGDGGAVLAGVLVLLLFVFLIVAIVKVAS